MHECPACGCACDCDGEDTWNDAAARDCIGCGSEECDDDPTDDLECEDGDGDEF